MEKIETINERLLNRYGKAENGLPLWRVVWSDDQFEKRWVGHTKEGFELINPVVEERPKYRQYIQSRHILERLVFVPVRVQTDLVVNHSYEPVFTFEDKDGNYLPPKWEVIEIVIYGIMNIAAESVGRKYEDERMKLSSDEFVESEKLRLEELKKDLFGNETSVGDALAYGYGVTVGDIKLVDGEIK